MKRLSFILFSLLLCSCENSQNNDSKTPIQYQNTVLGGCNDGFAMRSYSEESDTVAISVSDDNNIHVFVGKNYICEAPFETQCETINDTIFMYVIDSCEDIYGCYARCMCYYTFDFVFKQGELNQEYKIILIDPREEASEIIETGNFQNKLQPK